MNLSLKKSLILSFYSWCINEGLSPIIEVGYNKKTRAPWYLLKDNKLSINISPKVIKNMSLNQDLICFDAQFNGDLWGLEFFLDDIQRIYCIEIMDGITFKNDDTEKFITPQVPYLKLVKT